MLLCEADGKDLLRRHGIAVPRGRVLHAGDAAAPAAKPVVVKAQTLTGGRGKAGLVKLAAPDALAATVADIRARMEAANLPPAVLVEETLEIEREFYLAVRVDPMRQQPCLLFSAAGGMEVEDAADRLAVLPIAPGPAWPHQLIAFLRDAGAPAAWLGALSRLAADVVRTFLAEDAELIEINPVAALAGGRVIAADAKVGLDDNAGFRHARAFPLSAAIAEAERSPLEREAARQGFTLVEMPGDVVLITAGAGLGMMMVDLLADSGYRAATFTDNSVTNRADTTEERLTLGFELARRPQIRAIIFYVTLTSRSLKPRIDALIAFLERVPPPKPLIVAVSATHVAELEMSAAEARTQLAARGHATAAEPREVIARLREVAPIRS